MRDRKTPLDYLREATSGRTFGRENYTILRVEGSPGGEQLSVRTASGEEKLISLNSLWTDEETSKIADIFIAEEDCYRCHSLCIGGDIITEGESFGAIRLYDSYRKLGRNFARVMQENSICDYRIHNGVVVTGEQRERFSGRLKENDLTLIKSQLDFANEIR